MKTKLKKIALMALGAIAVAVFLALGGSTVSLSQINWSEIDWAAIIKENLSPKIVEALTLVFGTYIASAKSREKMDGAAEEFSRAAKAANTSAQEANRAASLSEEARAEAKAAQDKLLERVEALEGRFLEVSEQLGRQVEKTGTEAEKVVKILAAAFCDMEELVAKGTAKEITKVLGGGDDKDNA